MTAGDRVSVSRRWFTEWGGAGNVNMGNVVAEVVRDDGTYLVSCKWSDGVATYTTGIPRDSIRPCP